MNRRKFIGSCACCAFASCSAVLFNRYGTPFIRKKDNDFISHVEVHINEHCNLNCKYCNHFSCLAQKEFYDLDKFEQDIERMSFVFEKMLADLHIMGGEPLLNPDINKYIKIARKAFPITRMSIITNAILLDDMDKTFWETLNENHINIIPSLYPIKINWKSILKKAEKYNIGVYSYHDCKINLTLENIEKYRIHTFFKMHLKEDRYREDIGNVECKVKYECPNMQDGKLYPCATVAYIRHLNKKFNTNFKVTQKDYIDLYKIKNLNEAKHLIKTIKPPFCSYCMSNFNIEKWENCANHSLSEWA